MGFAEQDKDRWSKVGGPVGHIIADFSSDYKSRSFRPKTGRILRSQSVSHSIRQYQWRRRASMFRGVLRQIAMDHLVSSNPAAIAIVCVKENLRVAELEYHVHSRQLLACYRPFQKLPTDEMLVSSVETETDYSNKEKRASGTKRKGFQYTFELPTDPVRIGSMIGKDGENINRIIHRIQTQRQEKWYGPMPIDYEKIPNTANLSCQR